MTFLQDLKKTGTIFRLNGKPPYQSTEFENSHSRGVVFLQTKNCTFSSQKFKL